VLDATVRLMETNNFPSVGDIAAAAGMDIETTGRALQALEGTFLDLSKSYDGLESWNVSAVNADARRAVGQWPTAESLIARLAEAFDTAAEQEPDPERKSRLRTFAGWLGGAGRDIAVEVAAKVVEHQMGMG
jgi:hypothetical protein